MDSPSFDQVFPLLFEHLSRRDILQCRLVCMDWRRDVDYFLENNGFQRPVTLERLGGHRQLNPRFYGTRLRTRNVKAMLLERNLTYNDLSSQQMESLLREAVNYRHCPILGRSLALLETQSALTSQRKRFLQASGQHIWFFKITLRKIPPVDCVQRIFELISFLPNLLKLEIDCRPGHAPGKKNTDSISNNISRLLSQLERSWFRGIQLPQLETLQMNVVGWGDASIKDLISRQLCTTNMRSLSMDRMPIPNNFASVHLTDISLSVIKDNQLATLLNITSAVRRLVIGMSGRIDSQLLFQVVSHFRSSLRNFGLRITQGGYSLPAPDVDIRSQLRAFMDKGILTEFPHLKIISVNGCVPLSFNYLYGLRETLQDLHISMKRLERWEHFLQNSIPSRVREDEVVDLIAHLKMVNDVRSPKKSATYQSNVWKVFPKLKLVTVLFFEGLAEEEQGMEFIYTRDVYDRKQKMLLVNNS